MHFIITQNSKDNHINIYQNFGEVQECVSELNLRNEMFNCIAPSRCFLYGE